MVSISVENFSLKNRLKSDKGLVTIWDPTIKSDTVFVILVVELLIIGYSFFKFYLRVLLGSLRVILGHLDPLVPSVAYRSDLGMSPSYVFAHLDLQNELKKILVA